MSPMPSPTWNGSAPNWPPSSISSCCGKSPKSRAAAFPPQNLPSCSSGGRSNAAASVMLEALLGDRTYFVRRHMDFAPRTPDQVERLRMQNDWIRARSDDSRKIQKHLRDVLNGAEMPPADASLPALIEELSRYLKNPFTRSRDMTQMLTQAAPDVYLAEAAFEILERLGARQRVPRFAFIAGLKDEFSDAVMKEATEAVPGPRAISDGGYAVTVDDDDTVEVDDALSCQPLAGGGMRVRVHIALVADFVVKGGAMDQEAAARATTVYLPETTIRMLPDPISCRAASLIAGEDRPVLTTDVRLSADGELVEASIYPARIPIMRRLALRPGRLHSRVRELRRRRRRYRLQPACRRYPSFVSGAGPPAQSSCSGARPRSGCAATTWKSACSTTRRRVDAGGGVHGAEQFRRRPLCRREPDSDHLPRAAATWRRSGIAAPAPSLHPEYHAGVGLDFYAQLSSPIRRYADLVLQRQRRARLRIATAKRRFTPSMNYLPCSPGPRMREASGRESRTARQALLDSPLPRASRP